MTMQVGSKPDSPYAERLSGTSKGTGQSGYNRLRGFFPEVGIENRETFVL